jgi:dATP pyrophosphohydrolase
VNDSKARAEFQVLAFPFLFEANEPIYAIFRRDPDTGGYWQGVAGGGNLGESPEQAAIREVAEESGVVASEVIALDALAMIPVTEITTFAAREDIHVIPEYAFGVRASSRDLQLSEEHTTASWLRFDEAMALLRWDSNRTALWELDRRLRFRGGT